MKIKKTRPRDWAVLSLDLVHWRTLTLKTLTYWIESWQVALEVFNARGVWGEAVGGGGGFGGEWGALNVLELTR